MDREWSVRVAWPIECVLLALIAGSTAAAGQQAPVPESSATIHYLEPEKDPVQIADEAALRAQVKLSPNSPELLYQLALVERLNHEYSESLQTYTQAARLQKPNALQLRSVAFDYVELNDFNDATRWLRVAAEMEPNNIEVLYSLGRSLYSQNSFAEAESTFLRVLEMAPGHLRAEENLGLTYEEEHKVELAEVVLRTAVGWADKRKIFDPWPYINLGNLLLLENRAQDAIPLFRTAVSLAGNSGVSHERLGYTLGIVGDREGAVRELETAATLDPQSAKTHFELGRAYREAGKTDKARAEFDKSNMLYGSHSVR